MQEGARRLRTWVASNRETAATKGVRFAGRLSHIRGREVANLLP